MRAALFLSLAAAIFAQDVPDVDTPLAAARAAYAKRDYAAARTSLEAAWDLAQQLPPKDPQRYTILKQLSSVLSALGDYPAAQNYVELAIAWRELAVSRDDPKLPDEWIELASLCQRQRLFARALALLQTAQSSHIRTGGLESIPVADDYSRMALVQMDAHEPALAADDLVHAITLREKILGADAPAILAELDRLGSAYLALRSYADSETAFRRALLIRERLVGPNSGDLISTVEGLSYSLFGQKKYDEAERGYQRLLALWVQSTGDSAHPMIALTLDKIAVFYRAQERWPEAQDAASKANAIRELFLANGLSTEASARQALGDKKEATRLFAQALATLEDRPEYDSLRQQLENNLKELQIEIKPKPAAKKK